MSGGDGAPAARPWSVEGRRSSGATRGAPPNGTIARAIATTITE
jgi:hypothetical protein